MSYIGLKLVNLERNFVSEPSSEYVISLKAFNAAGEGNPVYETTITREETSKLLDFPHVKILYNQLLKLKSDYALYYKCFLIYQDHIGTCFSDSAKNIVAAIFRFMWILHVSKILVKFFH